MSNPIYGLKKDDSSKYEIPNELNVNLYLTTLKSILSQLASSNDKDRAITRIELLQAQLNSVIQDNPPQ
jgi:hypothetical protein